MIGQSRVLYYVYGCSSLNLLRNDSGDCVRNVTANSFVRLLSCGVKWDCIRVDIITIRITYLIT